MGNEEDRKKVSEQKKKVQSKFEGRLRAEESNPCLKEQDLSFKCINENSNSDEACQIYFDNYKNCKSFWLSVQQDRKRRNITPILPPPEEREKIKADFLKL